MSTRLNMSVTRGDCVALLCAPYCPDGTATHSQRGSTGMGTTICTPQTCYLRIAGQPSQIPLFAVIAAGFSYVLLSIMRRREKAALYAPAAPQSMQRNRRCRVTCPIPMEKFSREISRRVYHEPGVAAGAKLRSIGNA